MEEELDFYAYGQRLAEEYISNIKNLAKEIENKYGLDARIEFETGFSGTMAEQIEANTFDHTIPNPQNGEYYEGRIDIKPSNHDEKVI